MSKHIKNEGQRVEWQNVSILHKEHNVNKRIILEGIYIHKIIQLAMNERSEVGVTGTIYANLSNQI